MGLTLDELLPDYTASLNDARLVFGEDESVDQAENLTRHLHAAAAAISIDKRPRTAQASLTLVADQDAYTDVPADLLTPKFGLWGTDRLRAIWRAPRGPLPTLTLAQTAAGPALILTPAPSCEQIDAWGATYRYYYFASHAITDTASTSTLAARDKGLVILRAQVEAMRETAMRNAHKPVTLRDASAGGGQTRNTTPAALYAALLAEYERAP
jgi:hypothetical protein